MLGGAEGSHSALGIPSYIARKSGPRRFGCKPLKKTRMAELHPDDLSQASMALPPRALDRAPRPSSTPMISTARRRAAQLPSLDEAAGAHRAARGRFASKRIYTHVNNLLVAVNPYEELPLYGIDVLHSYAQYGEKSPAPHVFGVGAATYRPARRALAERDHLGRVRRGQDRVGQKFLQYLAYAATLGGGVTTAEAKLEQRVIATSPLMEASKTRRR